MRRRNQKKIEKVQLRKTPERVALAAYDGRNRSASCIGVIGQNIERSSLNFHEVLDSRPEKEIKDLLHREFIFCSRPEIRLDVRKWLIAQGC
ncbi:hypothetical protein M7I_0929 [Glarea lozoyensis 74030]|uniref:Uncharacterized protein n=1 Tax=Glarea lozoyensis (strain ATCC 74030 / MF5533) TaxID=1104152 RepID=H0EEP9_GLAL7|nr:hypothetical protein M7I_0929 [Glarea lozoyensis 74030]